MGLMILNHGCEKETPPGKVGSIVVSGDTGPWIVPCGCAANQAGGMPRRGTYLNQLRSTDEVLYLDAGGAAAGTSDYFREKFLAILRGESAMGIAVHNIGAAELKLGLDALRSAAADTKVKFISANVREASGSLAFPPVHVATVAGRRVAVVGVVSPKETSVAASGVRVDEPRQAILSAIETVKGQYDSLLVLAYLPDDQLTQLAASLPEAEAIIGGPTGQAIQPYWSGPSLIGSATNKGKYVVRLLLPADPKAPWQGEVAEVSHQLADDPQQTAILRQYLNRLGELDIPAVETGLARSLGATPESFSVAGSDSCISCHKGDYDIWHGSKHSHAADTLKQKGDFHFDAYCLQCHTTGFAQPKGFESLKRTPDRLGVGCESCHGPSQAHVSNPTVRTTYNAMDQCIRCHDQENSPGFHRERYWEKIKHGRNAVTKEASR